MGWAFIALGIFIMLMIAIIFANVNSIRKEDDNDD
jgi:uncharacterized membrane protein